MSHLLGDILVQALYEAIVVVQQGGSMLSLNLQRSHLSSILAHDWVVALQVVMLSLQLQGHQHKSQDQDIEKPYITISNSTRTG